MKHCFKDWSQSRVNPVCKGYLKTTKYVTGRYAFDPVSASIVYYEGIVNIAAEDKAGKHTCEGSESVNYFNIINHPFVQLS